MDNSLWTIFIGMVIGYVAGVLGSFMILKRLALVGDALTHVALPGMGLGLLFQFDPILGGFLFLIFAIVGTWYVAQYTTLSIEATVGVFFTLSLAAGVLIVPDHELLESLFGSVEVMGVWEGVLTIIAAVTVAVLIGRIYKGLILGVISEEYAKSAGVNSKAINFIFLFLVAVVVALGIRFVGALLMGALVIIPAASARNISTSLKGYMMLSGVIGSVCSGAGIFVANLYNVLPGVSVIIIASIVFFLSLAFHLLQVSNRSHTHEMEQTKL